MSDNIEFHESIKTSYQSEIDVEMSGVKYRYISKQYALEIALEIVENLADFSNAAPCGKLKSDLEDAFK